MGKLEKLFDVEKPVIGMIHLAGRDREEKIDRALRELKIYEEEGVSGAIVEDYHGSMDEINEAMERISREDFDVVVGVNCLRKPWHSVNISYGNGGRFVQYDSIQGDKFNPNLETFGQFVLGGVGFKYQPDSGNSLKYDLVEGMSRCDAIVTTGDGTGIETPISKLKKYKEIIVDFPLIVGAGLNFGNVYDSLKVADGGIVGSCFKPRGDTSAEVDRRLVRKFMEPVFEVREAA
jgi:uncharacterized protein